MANLQQWLKDIGLGQYTDLFAENGIDAAILSTLNDVDLERLGIRLGDRKKLLKAAASHKPLSPTQQPVAHLRAERRHLTVLFCDMVGSTALSVSLDPEDLRDILHEFQNRCSDAVKRYEGRVARLMGDGVLAYFGFPTAHEDDAERAVNAALAMQQSISALTTPTAQQLKCRVGIATGIVVVGDLVGAESAREFSLVGEAPNLAARWYLVSSW